MYFIWNKINQCLNTYYKIPTKIYLNNKNMCAVLKYYGYYPGYWKTCGHGYIYIYIPPNPKLTVVVRTMKTTIKRTDNVDILWKRTQWIVIKAYMLLHRRPWSCNSCNTDHVWVIVAFSSSDIIDVCHYYFCKLDFCSLKRLEASWHHIALVNIHAIITHSWPWRSLR